MTGRQYKRRRRLEFLDFINRVVAQNAGLFAGGRTNSLMPVAQFNQFEKLDKPIMQAGGEADAYKLWHQLSDERNRYSTWSELIGSAKPASK